MLFQSLSNNRHIRPFIHYYLLLRVIFMYRILPIINQIPRTKALLTISPLSIILIINCNVAEKEYCIKLNPLQTF